MIISCMKGVAPMYDFDVIAEVFDYGESVTALIIDIKKEVKSESIHKSTFIVEAKNYNQENEIYYEGERQIIDVYTTDDRENFKLKQEKGHYLVLLLDYGFNDKASASIYYNMVMKDGVWDFFKSYNLELKLNYTIRQLEDIEGIHHHIVKTTKYKQKKVVRPIVDKFIYKKSKTGLYYRQYIPEIISSSYPLIIWFHGSGEGGNNNSAQVLSNKGGTGFACKEAQEIFNGAYVVAPQCPDNWAIDPDVFKSVNIPLTENIKASKDYAKEAVLLIKEVLTEYPNIDAKRIYIAGCSAGGAMTWKTLLEAPKMFAAAIPICGSLVDKEKLRTVIDVPIWLIHSKDDTTVTCKNSEENYEHLIELGGKAHLTEYEKVCVNGECYPGHWSWVYALNNDPKLDDGTTLFKWLSQQKRKD